ncbi:MAG: biosynthetic peptidoglycan transglycosylase [Absicoccus sp.]|uniref:Transglycosylase domain-containing protein n=1 Tax=Absicoccus intestinalis TaxID=2926319 RepID=A0ABU4WR71_9FIRM|nr:MULTISPECIES: biosynthetic peptidoglycan transglycosylase [unclassified Absicoccus]MDX8418288.1 transglycosylase domain-containing protein [Absicoccus sp. CLA-KB-P134]MDY3034682.1 biosynthetic peptidoglycan transglycosylase [Absicoccus sp.]
MKKILHIFLVVVAVLSIGIASLAFYGYIQFQRFSAQTGSLTTLVEQVESSDAYVDYHDLPNTLVRATVSIEDHRFFEHDGVDTIGLIRALLSQINENLVKSGGSTITQQLAKNLYGQYDSNLSWKMAEFFFARELESHYSKSEIFALYVSVINYGNGYTGIKQASEGYFGKEPADLSDAQCTILAGIPQVPSKYALISTENVEAAKKRQKLVLAAMVEYKYLNQTQADEIYAESIWQ